MPEQARAATAPAAPTTIPECRICLQRDGSQLHVAREMMFGLRERFTYLECGGCGCLQLLDVPADLGPYYPDNYYAFDAPEVHPYSALHRLIRRQKQSYCLGNRTNLIGMLLARRQAPDIYIQWLMRAGGTFGSAILDVGCGAGHLLRELQRDGFTNLTGVDPYLREEIREPGLNTYRRELADLSDRYDIALLNHSFEHMADPEETLRTLASLLRPGGTALIRIPVADSHAWRTYGVDWFQLDAPRHLYLHTKASMRLLAERTGFDLEHIDYDSFEIQFIGSEGYRRDIPYIEIRERSPFSEAEVTAFREEAWTLNGRGEGDQACFYLRRRSSG